MKFCYEITKKYPKIKKKISLKYKLIFIDEYQDTSSYILNLFYEVVEGSNTKLYIFGDKMQQIYNNYDGGFDKRLSAFKKESLDINYRSSTEIVNTLNLIYNDSNFFQTSFNGPCNVKPKLTIYDGEVTQVINKEREKNNDLLVLYLLNNDKYTEIGGQNLYLSVIRMEKYSFGSKYTANDLLSNNTTDNPDKLFRLLFMVSELIRLYENNEIGKFFQAIKKSNLFLKKNISIVKHEDKRNVYKSISNLREKYYSDISIGEFIAFLQRNKWIKDISDIIDNPDYSNTLAVKVKELINIDAFLRKPQISTQHGVKGESHTSVAFISANSTNPNVKMNAFFKLFSLGDISVTELEVFNDKYMNLVRSIKELFSITRLSELKAAQYNGNKDNVKNLINDFIKNNVENIYYKTLLENDMNTYDKNSNVSNLKNAVSETKISGVITAYKLFYVGCSRARKKLFVYVEAKMVSEFNSDFKTKMKNIGFEVTEELCISEN